MTELFRQLYELGGKALKVPKCEIFDLLPFTSVGDSLAILDPDPDLMNLDPQNFLFTLINPISVEVTQGLGKNISHAC